MKVFIALIIAVISVECFADDSGKAAEYFAKAALKTETGKKLERRVKALVETYVNKEASAAIVAGTAMAVDGKIDTNKFNYKMKINKKAYVKPYVIYDIKENVTTGMFYMKITY